MRRATISLTLVFIFLLAGNLFAMQGLSSTARMTDLAAQTSGNQDANSGAGGQLYMAHTHDNLPPDNDHSTEYGQLETEINFADANAGGDNSIDTPPATVPEPTSLILLGLGMMGVSLLRRKK